MKRSIFIFLIIFSFLFIGTCEKTVIKFVDKENGSENTDSLKTVKVYYKVILDICSHAGEAPSHCSINISYVTPKEIKYNKFENVCKIEWRSSDYTFNSGEYIELSASKYYQNGGAYGGCCYIYLDDKVWKYFCLGKDLETKKVCGNIP